MYLSELFLQHMGSDMTYEKAIVALKQCNEQICREMDWKDGQEISSSIFLCKDKKGEVSGLNKKGQEIMDFWDVYKEFDNAVQKETKEKIPLLEAVALIKEEVEKRRTCNQ